MADLYSPRYGESFWAGRAVKEYRNLFIGCFLKRFLDVNKDIRLIMLTWARDFLLTCSQVEGEVSTYRKDVATYVVQRLQDPDEAVRSEVSP